MLCLWVTKRVPPRLVVALLATTTFALCWVDGGSRAPLSTAGFCAPGSHFIDRTARRDADSDRRYKRDLAVLRRRKHAWCCSSETTRGVEADDDDAENPKDTLVGGVVSREASQRKLEALEAWLDDIGVDRGGSCGSDGENRPSVKLKRFPLGGIGLECTRELERDSTVRRFCVASWSTPANDCSQLDNCVRSCFCISYSGYMRYRLEGAQLGCIYVCMYLFVPVMPKGL